MPVQVAHAHTLHSDVTACGCDSVFLSAEMHHNDGDYHHAL
jgi:hypothetical protein